MPDDVQNTSKREIVVDSDWVSAACMAIGLVSSVLLAITEVRAIVQGHYGPVSYDTVVLAVFMTYLAVVAGNDKLFRVGTSALAIGAGIRALAHYSHASPTTQQLAGINDLICSLFAAIVMFVWAVQWFRGVSHLRNKVNPSE